MKKVRVILMGLVILALTACSASVSSNDSEPYDNESDQGSTGQGSNYSQEDSYTSSQEENANNLSIVLTSETSADILLHTDLLKSQGTIEADPQSDDYTVASWEIMIGPYYGVFLQMERQEGQKVYTSDDLRAGLWYVERENGQMTSASSLK